MKNYKIYFSQVVKQREFNVAYVKADSEEEAMKKFKEDAYYDFDTRDIDVIETGEFEDIEIEEL